MGRGILAELEQVHPNIRQLTTRLDVFRNGHAMRRPVPGSLWGKQSTVAGKFQSPESPWHMPICLDFRCLRKRSIAVLLQRSAS